MSDDDPKPSTPGDVPRVPTKDDLKLIPRWARVAFAARCARRVQPLFKHTWAEAPQVHIDAVDQAITLAEVWAARHAVANARDANAAIARAARAAAAYARAANANAAVASTAIARAANARAANAAAAAADAVDAVDASKDAARAAAAAAAAAEAVDASNDAARAAAKDATTNAMWLDYELLCELMNGRDGTKPWTDDTPVPPELFGPYWPEGEPEGWYSAAPRNDQPSGDCLVYDIEIPEGVDDEEIEQRIVALIAASSAHHLRHGGSGLTLRGIQVESETLVPQGGRE